MKTFAKPAPGVVRCERVLAALRQSLVGHASTADIARQACVEPAEAARALRRLHRWGYVRHLGNRPGVPYSTMWEVAE